MGEFPVGASIIPNPYNQIPGFSLDEHWFVPGFPVMAWPMLEWVLDTHYADLFHRARACGAFGARVRRTRIARHAVDGAASRRRSTASACSACRRSATRPPRRAPIRASRCARGATSNSGSRARARTSTRRSPRCCTGSMRSARATSESTDADATGAQRAGARWCCSPAARTRRRASRGRSSASGRSRRSASTTDSGTRSS